MTLVQVKILAAQDVHKADATSKTDCTLKVFDGDRLLFQSKVIESLNPVWNESFFASARFGALRFELWDGNTFTRDELLGLAMVVFPPPSGAMDVPIHYSNPTYTEKTVLKLEFSPPLRPYSDVAAEITAAGIPGVLLDSAKQKILLPVSRLSPDLYLAIEYEEYGYDIKLFLTSPRVYADIVVSSVPHTSLRRRVYATGNTALLPGHRVYEELKLDDVPLTVPRSAISFLVFDRSDALMSMTLDGPVSRAGWKGAMDYSSCRTALKGVTFWDKEKEVLFPIEEGFFVAVDFDKDNVDMKALVMEGCPLGSTSAFYLSMDDVTTKSVVYSAPRAWGDGASGLRVVREFELDDVPFGSTFASMKLHRYEITNMRSCTLPEVISL